MKIKLILILLALVLVTQAEAQWWEQQPMQIQNLRLEVKHGHAGTLTLPNPGAGLGIYILAVDWIVCGSRELKADTGFKWTTTNLRGLAWSGTIFARRGDWPNCYTYSSPAILRTWPVQSEAPSTVVTFAFPPTNYVAASINVYYAYTPWFDGHADERGPKR